MNMDRAPQTKDCIQPNKLLVSSVLQRKCDCGNKTLSEDGCTACANKKNALQRKFSIGASNDPLEHEADRVADQVMSRKSSSTISSAPVKIQCSSSNTLSREETVPSSVNSVLARSGSPIRSGLRRNMETRFGHDFSKVRIHTDNLASRSAHDVNARAYTVGNNIVFANGQYAPSSQAGNRLLAHELTHTVQQASGGAKRVQRESWNDDETNCDSEVTYLIQLLFEDTATDTWTPARKTTFKNAYKNSIETAFNANTFKIRPLGGSDACPCANGFSPQLKIDFVPDGENSVSEDLEVDVVANSNGAVVQSSQNTTFGYGDLDESDNSAIAKASSAPGVTQIPSVHEFGHFLGLQHPGHNLEAGIFEGSRLSPGANEYGHTGTDENGRAVDGPNDLMGSGMGLRPFYFDSWVNHIKSEYNRFCFYRIT